MRGSPLLTSLVGALLVGCAGYRLGPTDGRAAGTRTVRVAYFENHTLEPRLSEAMTHALRKRLQQDGTYRLATDGPADVLVTGQILRYERVPISFQPRDVITTRDYELNIVVRLVAREAGDDKPWLDREVTGRTYMRVQADQTSAERQALPQAAEDFAQKAVPLIVDGPW